MLNIGKRLSVFANALVIAGAFSLFLSSAPAAHAAAAASTPAPAKAAATVAAAPVAAKAKTAVGMVTTKATPQETKAPVLDSDLLAAPKTLGIDVTADMQDRVLGNPNAPVTVVEYASLTCPHCAHFDTEILPQVKKKLIDTGKLKLIYRDFPLDKFALKAAMMARCVSPLKYFDMLGVIFANQQRWIKAKDPMAALAQLGSLAGMDASQFQACTTNKDLEADILTNMKQAERMYKVDATPTFIFNDGAAQFKGAYPVTKFEEVVASLTKTGK